MCQVYTLYSFSSFSLCILFSVEKSAMYSTQLQSEKLCSTILRTEYINSGGLFCMGDSSVLPHLVIIYKFKLVLAHEYSIYMMIYNSTLLYILSCVEFYLWLLRSSPPMAYHPHFVYFECFLTFSHYKVILYIIS